MVAWLLLLPLAYLAAIAETTLSPAAALGPVQPMVVASLAALWLLARRRTYDFLVAGLLGLLVDLLSPGNFGLSTVTFLITSFGLSLVARGWAVKLLPVRLLLTFLFVWTVAQIDAMATAFFVTETARDITLLWLPLAVAAYSTALALPCWMILGWWQEELVSATAPLPAPAPAPSESTIPVGEPTGISAPVVRLATKSVTLRPTDLAAS